MSKNIVVCSDGTGGKGFQKRGTNVFKLFEAVDIHNQVIPQIAFYDDGVGTENYKLLKILGGAFGYGLSRNVKQLYASLLRTYQKGDKIYLFGFSRGAFTVRTLSGLINTFGIPNQTNFKSDTELLKETDKIYSEYRRKYSTLLSIFFDFFRLIFRTTAKRNTPVEIAPIEFIGVWDTVDAVGAPIVEIAKFINKFIYRYKFKDYKLSPVNKVKKACHALSIDDERLTFHPAIWDEEDEEIKGRVEQVWFAGVHSNVGGGYPKHGMSLISLDWMMSKAEQAGLKFICHDRKHYSDRMNVNDKLYNSRSGLRVYYRYKPRDIGKKCQKNHFKFKPQIHDSVIERIIQCTEGYTPGNIPADCEIVSTDGKRSKHTQLIRAFNANHHKGEKSLLDRAKWWVRIRRFSNYALLFSTIIAFCFILFAEISKTNFVSTLKMLFSGRCLVPFSLYLLYKPYIPITIIAFYLIGRYARKKMNRVYSEFWYTTVQEAKNPKKDTEDVLDKTS